MNSSFEKFQFLEEKEEDPINDEIVGGDSNNTCKGGLCLEKSIKTNHPTVSQFKDLIVPIGLVLESRTIDLHNELMNIESELQPVNESMFEQLFLLANGRIEKSK